MSLSSLLAERLALLCIAEHAAAADAADQRAREAAEVARRLLTLRIYREGDRAVLASAIAEQTARTKLADQTRRNALTARASLTEAQRGTRYGARDV